MNMRQFVAAGAASAALSALVVGVLPATPAAAALATCTEAGWGIEAGGVQQVQVPWSSAATNPWNCQLKSGNTGDGVWALQRGLKICYKQSITVDGSFGSATKAALKNAQTALKVSVDGVYGPQTRKHFLFANDFTDSGLCGEIGY